jgi:hypothetical protein
MNSQNNSYWSIQNPLIIDEFPLLGLKVGVWCAMSKHGLLGLLLVYEIKNSQWYILHILIPSLEHISSYKVTYALLFNKMLQQPTQKTFWCVFGDRLIIGDFGLKFKHNWTCVIFIVKYVKAQNIQWLLLLYFSVHYHNPQ